MLLKQIKREKNEYISLVFVSGIFIRVPATLEESVVFVKMLFILSDSFKQMQITESLKVELLQS